MNVGKENTGMLYIVNNDSKKVPRFRDTSVFKI